MTTLFVTGQNVPRRDFPERLVGQARHTGFRRYGGFLASIALV